MKVYINRNVRQCPIAKSSECNFYPRCEFLDFESLNLAEAPAEDTPPANLLISKFNIPPRRRLRVPNQIKNIVITKLV